MVIPAHILHGDKSSLEGGMKTEMFNTQLVFGYLMIFIVVKEPYSSFMVVANKRYRPAK